MQVNARAGLVLVMALVLAGWAPAAPVRAAATLNVPSDYPTIQAAIDAAAEGDTVSVAAGTYAENLLVTKSITVAGAGAEVTTIRGVSGDPVVFLHTQQAVTMALRGFTITGGSSTFGGGVRLLGAGAATIADNVIKGNYAGGSGGGIDINGGGTSVIERNIISGNTAQQGAGISVVNTLSPMIRNNLVAGNTGSNGAGIYLSLPASAAATIVNNTIAGNTGAIGPGVSASGQGAGVRVQDNIVTGATAAATVFCDATNNGTALDLRGNDVLNSAGEEYDGVCAGTTGSAGNVSVAPRFVDQFRGDYHLRADSPLIDAGQNAGSPATDIDGDARPFDGDEDGTAVTDPGFDEAVDPLLVDPAYLYMGNVDVGANGLGTVTLTNLGDGPMSIASAVIDGPDAADFAIAVPQDDTCSGTVLAVAASCHVTVSIIPTVIAVRRARLTINGHGAVGTRTIPLEAVGIDPILVLGGPITFGGVVRGASSAAQQVEVDNYGPPVSIDGVTVGGPATSDFIISADTCTGQTIPKAGNCTFGVTFTPTADGPRTATVSITGPGIVGTRTVDVSGTGTPPASGVSWGTTYAASSAYAWNSGLGLARTMQGTTQRLHGLYATNRVAGAWAKESGPYEGVYYTRSTSGSSWSAGRRLNPTTQHAERLAVAAAGSRVYAAWVSQRKLTVSSTSTSPRILYLRVNTDHGGSASWRKAIRLTTTSGRVDFPSVAASGTDVHVAWTDSATGSVKLATSRDRGATWEKRTIGTTTGGTSANRSGFPSVAVSGSVVVVSWQADHSGAIKARVSTNRAASWDATKTLAAASSGYFASAARGSRLAVTWTGNDGVVLATRNGPTWTAPVVVTRGDGTHDQYSPAVSMQAGNRIGIAWSEVAATPDRPDLHWIESSDGGASWYQAQVIGSSDASASRRVNDWPSVVWVSEGTRYIAWNGWTPQTSHYRLYVRKGAGMPVGPMSTAPGMGSARTDAPAQLSGEPRRP